MDVISEISRLRKIFAEADYFDDQYIAGALMALDAVVEYFDDREARFYVQSEGLYLVLDKNDLVLGFIFDKSVATVFKERKAAEGYALITGGIVEVAE